MNKPLFQIPAMSRGVLNCKKIYVMNNTDDHHTIFFSFDGKTPICSHHQDKKQFLEHFSSNVKTIQFCSHVNCAPQHDKLFALIGANMRPDSPQTRTIFLYEIMPILDVKAIWNAIMAGLFNIDLVVAFFKIRLSATRVKHDYVKLPTSATSSQLELYDEIKLLHLVLHGIEKWKSKLANNIPSNGEEEFRKEIKVYLRIAQKTILALVETARDLQLLRQNGGPYLDPEPDKNALIYDELHDFLKEDRRSTYITYKYKMFKEVHELFLDLLLLEYEQQPDFPPAQFVINIKKNKNAPGFRLKRKTETMKDGRLMFRLTPDPNVTKTWIQSLYSICDQLVDDAEETKVQMNVYATHLTDGRLVQLLSFHDLVGWTLKYFRPPTISGGYDMLIRLGESDRFHWYCIFHILPEFLLFATTLKNLKSVVDSCAVRFFQYWQSIQNNLPFCCKFKTVGHTNPQYQIVATCQAKTISAMQTLWETTYKAHFYGYERQDDELVIFSIRCFQDMQSLFGRNSEDSDENFLEFLETSTVKLKQFLENYTAKQSKKKQKIKTKQERFLKFSTKK